MTPPLSPARAPVPATPVVMFLTGPAGCGKTTLAEAWVRHQIGHGQPWTLLDKDLVGGLHGQRLLELLGADPKDRDSPLFKKEVRHLDYAATLQVAAAQLALGGSVILPGPWTQELVEGLLADPVRIGLPPVPSVVAWLSISDATRRQRIIDRGHPLDAWKLAHWEFYSKGSRNGEPPPCRGPAPDVIAAELPLAAQMEALARLVDARRAGHMSQAAAPKHGGQLARTGGWGLPSLQPADRQRL
ncbi:MAG TPA: hypothetical protein VGE20_20090 [Ramlibacter sp.]